MPREKDIISHLDLTVCDVPHLKEALTAATIARICCICSRPVVAPCDAGQVAEFMSASRGAAEAQERAASTTSVEIDPLLTLQTTNYFLAQGFGNLRGSELKADSEDCGQWFRLIACSDTATGLSSGR